MTSDDTALTMPKAELHLHIEGALEPELAFELARRNGVTLPYADVADLRRRYDFADLQSFLDLYYTGMSVLCTARDFTDLADSYLTRASRQGVRHAEIFFDPQAHTTRGVSMSTIIDGLEAALSTSEQRFGISTRLIACFLRDHGPEAAKATFDELLPHSHRLTGVGLDSAELGYPPRDFETVFARARDAGLRLVAHAGEEGPPEYIWQTLDVLGVERVDHGVRAVEEDALLRRLADDRMPLTVCPISNVRLRCVDTLDVHPLPRLVAAGLSTSINSDDPTYFGGYVGDNFHAVQQHLGFDDAALRQFAANSFQASFLDQPGRDRLLGELDPT